MGRTRYTCLQTPINNLQLAAANEAYVRTGCPTRGMPCFGYDALLVMDPKVLEQEFVYTGGGSEFSVARMSTKEILRIKNPVVKKITGKKSN